MIDKDLEMKLNPKECSSASALIVELIEDFGVKQSDLARRLGISEKHMSRILHKETFMSVELAERLEIVTGLSAKLLLGMDADYKLAHSKVNSKERRDDELYLKPYDWQLA
ncbi:HigA family addiction module antitoxin [Fructobacillus sp. W13]|uniref:HigA family addiction module antitoxin n=1 Tax=Fructobacillus apis TaxID=2935017 RepID=A0ABT0ZPZ5_9LACO|nr:HigA family addiction module antitoxin [Fructobacillus apis]MCO0832062.1 HigA family addiction module antitoxin [Fructobacillus apis]